MAVASRAVSGGLAVRTARQRWLIAASVPLLLTSVLTIVFKNNSTGSWPDIRPREMFTQHMAPSTDWTKVTTHTPLYMVIGGPYRDDPKGFSEGIMETWQFSNISIFFASVVGLLVAVLTLRNAFFISSAKFLDRILHTAANVGCYLCAALALASFTYLTVQHSKSHAPHLLISGVYVVSDLNNGSDMASWPSEELIFDRSSLRFMYRTSAPFDLEAWTCALRERRLTIDDKDVLGKTCVGEAGSRWSLLPLTLAAIVLAVVMERDRRMAGRCQSPR